MPKRFMKKTKKKFTKDKKQDKQIRQLIRYSTPEVKTYSDRLPQSQGTVATMGFDQMLYPMTIGTGNGTRVGQKVLVRAIHFRATVCVIPVTSSPLCGQYVRIIMYYNRAYDAVNIIAPGTILESASISDGTWDNLQSAVDIDVFDNSIDNTRNQNRILFDKSVTFGFNERNSTNSQSSADGSVRTISYKKTFKKPLEITWSTTSPAEKQLLLNVMFGPFVTSTYNPALTYNYTIFYTDA